MHEEERDVLGDEENIIDECDLDKFGTLHCSEKTITILVGGGHRRRNRKGT